jgi:hypothetical protein
MGFKGEAEGDDFSSILQSLHRTQDSGNKVILTEIKPQNTSDCFLLIKLFGAKLKTLLSG